VILRLIEYYEKFLKDLKMYKVNSEVAKDQIRLVDEFYFKFKKLRGIGQGDAKLLAAIGSILGWQAVFPILCFAAILGVVVGLCLIRAKRLTIQQRIPFGPFLSLFACVFILEKIVPFKS
jgi:prepilin signal peptidase PulO-like enzyme (type II secretory pathway)